MRRFRYEMIPPRALSEYVYFFAFQISRQGRGGAFLRASHLANSYKGDIRARRMCQIVGIFSFPSGGGMGGGMDLCS